ncbi:MAG: glycosyltransferase family 2 protein [Candidatus Micrarchaeia archaeon]
MKTSSGGQSFGKRVSVVVPLYNAEKFIAKTLESIRAQEHFEFEVIILDNGSSDKSAQIAEQFCQRDPRFKLYKNNKNIGYVPNLNRGLENATGDYIAFLHADDLWDEKFLSSSIALFAKYPSAGMCFCRFENIDAEGNLHKTKARNALGDETRLIEKDRLFEMYIGRDFTPVCTIMVLRKAQDEAGEYDVQYPGPCDYGMWLKISARFDGIYNSGSTSKYRIHGSSGTSWLIDISTILMEQYSMAHKIFREYLKPGEKDEKLKKKLLRNTALSALRQAANSIAQGKGGVCRSKCALAVAIYPEIDIQIISACIYFASIFTIILSPILSVLIPACLPLLKRLKLY